MKLQFFLFFLMTSFYSFAQVQALDTTDYSRLPDKVYLHFDKNLYSQGDTIWVKAYAFHRNNQKMSNNSYSLHMQVISHTGKVVGSYKILMVNGLGAGQIPVYESMKPGFYQVIAHTGYMKNFGMQFFYKTTLEIRSKMTQMSIKTYFNKLSYELGDTARVTFHVFDEFHMPMRKKRFRYELVCDDKVLKRSGLRCYEDGTVMVRLPILEGSKKNPPCINLYYYEENMEDKSILQQVYVPLKDKEIIVQFFPEGGDLIRGVPCKVAFEATNSLGETVPIEGMLQEDGNDVLSVSTLHKGMGYFALTPTDATYTFRITKPTGVDSLFKLPLSLNKGYNISYIKQDEKKIYLQVSHNFLELKHTQLWVSQYDDLINVYDLELAKRRIFTLSKENLPQGLVTFTLTDENDIPKAERLVYIPTTNKEVTIITDEKIYSQRKKVKVTIALGQGEEKADLSVAIIDSVLGNSPYLDVDNIKTYALLRSELRGKIDHINNYLLPDKKTEQQRDLLVLTHGWRRYNWLFNQEQLDSLTIFNFNHIDGEVKRNRKPQPKAQLTAMVLGSAASFAQFKTDGEGRFRITPKYEDRKSQKILFMAKSTKGKDNVNITIHNTDTVLFGRIANTYKDDLKALVHDYNNFVNDDNDKEEDLPFLSYETKLLKELVVFGDRVDPNDEDAFSEMVTSFSAGALSGKDLVGGYSFGDFVEQASFRAQYNRSTDRVIVRGRGGNSNMSIGENEEIDSNSEGFGFGEMEVDQKGAEIYVNDMSWGKDVSGLDFLTKEEIAEIVVLDPEGAFGMYGSSGEYGVILVRTHSDYLSKSKNSINRNLAIFGHFIDSKEYYKTVYETKQQDSLVVVDNRITLHWEPFLETDENGKASFEFYTDDISGTKQIIVQGMDKKGNLYCKTQEFDVQVVGY